MGPPVLQESAQAQSGEGTASKRQENLQAESVERVERSSAPARYMTEAEKKAAKEAAAQKAQNDKVAEEAAAQKAAEENNHGIFWRWTIGWFVSSDSSTPYGDWAVWWMRVAAFVLLVLSFLGYLAFFVWVDELMMGVSVLTATTSGTTAPMLGGLASRFFGRKRRPPTPPPGNAPAPPAAQSPGVNINSVVGWASLFLDAFEFVREHMGRGRGRRR
jgi:hypothetical protein